MKKKLIQSATVTYFNEYNYGAVLQAYALQTFLKNNGFENQIVQYSTRNEHIFDKLPRELNRQWLYFCKKNMMALFNASKLKNKRARFDRFISGHLELTPRYGSFEELEHRPPNVDVLFAGSDQIWNITNHMRKDFFLMFGEPTAKRVSYAASMGLCDFTDEKRNQLMDAIAAFDLVSVREQEAAEYLKKGGIEAEVMADPTLLLRAGQWSALAEYPEVEGNYILCYPLLYHKDIDRTLLELKRATGLKVVTIQPNPESKFYADISILDAGPAEFLGLFKNAEYVVTSSFHGTAFSLIFNKEFYAFNSAATKGRIVDLLKRTQLLNRFNPTDIAQHKPIDYLSVNTILNSEVKKAENFMNKIEGLL